MISPEKKKQAIALRKAGHTYKEISDKTGISVDWCKRNLKEVGKTSSASAIVLNLSERPEGVSESEIRRVSSTRGKDPNNVKKVVRRKNPNALFRPDWLSLEKPEDSHWSMLLFADTLHNTIQDLVNDYQREYPDTQRTAVIQEMTKLASPWLIPGGIEDYCDRLATTVQRITLQKKPLE